MQPHADDVRTIGDDVVILGGCAVRGSGQRRRDGQPDGVGDDAAATRKVIRHRGFVTREEALDAAGLS